MQWFLKIDWVDWAGSDSVFHCELSKRNSSLGEFGTVSSDMVMDLRSVWDFVKKLRSDHNAFYLNANVWLDMVKMRMDTLDQDERGAILIITQHLYTYLPDRQQEPPKTSGPLDKARTNFLSLLVQKAKKESLKVPRWSSSNRL